MSSRRESASVSASERRSRVDGDGAGEDSSAGRGVGIPEIGSPTSGVARCELCGVDCSSGPRLRSKKTGAYRHRECPDEVTARELLREERRAARAAARGEAYVTSDTKTSEERTPRRSDATPRSVSSGRSKGVRWRDSAGSDDESASGTPVSSRDRQIRRRARVAEDVHRARSPSEDSGEDRDSGTRRRRSRPREEKRRSLDGRHRDASRHREARGLEHPRSAASRARVEADNLDNLDVEIEMFLAWVRDLYETTPSRTFFVLGAALAVVLVSRSSVSAAIALAGAFASLAAIGAAIGVEERLANVSRTLSLFPATAARRLAPALEAARVLLGWLEASASAAVVFAAGLFATLAAALVDAAQELSRRRDLFLKSVEEKRRRDDALETTETTATVAETTTTTETKTANPCADPTSSRASSLPDEDERRTDGEEDETAQLTTTPKRTSDVRASDDVAEVPRPTRDGVSGGSNASPDERSTLDENAAAALRAAQIDLAEALDELSVTRRELEAARADAEAARRGRAGAVERAAAAAATTTRAENRETAEALEREVARARLEGTRAAADAAAEARRIASDEHARLRETVRDLEARLAEAEHLSSARDALELAARAKAAETQRRLAEAESRHEAETRAGAEDRERFERETLRRAEETAESARRAAVEAVDAARRETAHELLSTSRAAEAECARLSAVKERVERDWRLATERAEFAEEEASATMEAARAAEGFLQKATERAGALQREVDALRGEKKHLWERVEYAEWRLAKLGLDKTTFSPEEAAVAARPGGPSGNRNRAASGGWLGASQEKASQEKPPGPSAEGSHEESRETRNAKRDPNAVETGSVRKMAASFEKRSPRRSEAEALMRRVRALETEASAREGAGDLADAFAEAT